jgi:hypothetical protein
MFHVKYVATQPGIDPRLAVTHLAGDGWIFSRTEIISRIRAGDSFYVRSGTRNIWLEVVLSPVGEYLRTVADGDVPFHLMSLSPLSDR